MEQIFADRAVANNRAIDFVEAFGEPHYVIALSQGYAVCDAEGLERHRPACYATFERGKPYPIGDTIHQWVETGKLSGGISRQLCKHCGKLRMVTR